MPAVVSGCEALIALMEESWYTTIQGEENCQIYQASRNHRLHFADSCEPARRDDLHQPKYRETAQAILLQYVRHWIKMFRWLLQIPTRIEMYS